MAYESVEYCRHCTGFDDYQALVAEVLRHESADPYAALNADARRRSVRRGRAWPSSPLVTPQEVTFTIEAPGAGQVLLAGDFNDWDPTGSAMHLIGGVWTKVMKLSPGRYRYRYVVDGPWQHDPSNAAVELNPYGGTTPLSSWRAPPPHGRSRSAGHPETPARPGEGFGIERRGPERRRREGRTWPPARTERWQHACSWPSCRPRRCTTRCPGAGPVRPAEGTRDRRPTGAWCSRKACARSTPRSPVTRRRDRCARRRSRKQAHDHRLRHDPQRRLAASRARPFRLDRAQRAGRPAHVPRAGRRLFALAQADPPGSSVLAPAPARDATAPPPANPVGQISRRRVARRPRGPLRIRHGRATSSPG